MSMQVCGRSPTRDVSRCGCEVNARASTRSDQREQRNGEGRTNRDMGAPSRWSDGRTVERGPAGAGDVGTSEGGGRKDAKRIRGIVHDDNKNKRLSRVQNEMENLMFSVWEGCHWDDNKGGWLDLELCARARREEVEYIRHQMYTRVSSETCLREKGTHQDRMGGYGQGTTRETQRTREVGREGIHDEARAVIATGKRGGKVVALVDVRRAWFYAPARRRASVELPPEDYQQGDEHMCGLVQYILYGTLRFQQLSEHNALTPRSRRPHCQTLLPRGSKDRAARRTRCVEEVDLQWIPSRLVVSLGCTCSAQSVGQVRDPSCL